MVYYIARLIVAELKTEKNEGCTKSLSVARSYFKIHVFCSQLKRFLNNRIRMSLSANYLASYFLPSFNKSNYVEFRTIVTASSLPRKGIF